MSAACPNKSHPNYKLIAKVYGDEDTLFLYNLHGSLPNVADHPHFKSMEKGGDVITRIKETMAKINAEEARLIRESAAGNKPTGKHKLLLDNKKFRRARLSGSLTRLKEDGDVGKRVKIENEIKLLDEEIASLKKDASTENIISLAERDMDYVMDLVDSGSIFPSEITTSQKVLNLLMDVQHHLIEDGLVEKGSDEYNRLIKIQSEANEYDHELTKIRTKHVESKVKRNQGLDELTQTEGDISYMEMQYMDATHTENPIVFDTVSRIRKQENKTRKAVEAISDRFEKMIAPLNKRFGKSRVYEMITQKTEGGKQTGSFTSLVKPEYKDTLNKLRFEASTYGPHADNKVTRKLAMKKYLKFRRDNEIIFDVRKLFGDVEGREEHEAELIELIGKAEFDKKMKDLSKSVNKYNKREVARRINAEDGNAQDKKNFQDWVIENSPFVLADHLDPNVKSKKYDKVRPMGYKNLVSIPKSKEWYDPRFAEIVADEELYKFYNSFTETIRELNAYMPDEKKQDLNENGIPYIEKEFGEIFREREYDKSWALFQKALLNTVSANEEDGFTAGYVDPKTGKEDKFITAPNVSDKELISREVNLMSVDFLEENGRQPTMDEKKEIYQEARDKVSRTRSKDLLKVLTGYALLAEAYKHKSEIEDDVRLASHHINNQKEGDKSTEESFRNEKDRFNYTNDKLFYGANKKSEGISKEKSYTPIEKRKKADLQKKLKNESLTPAQKTALENEMESLGSRTSVSDAVDAGIKLTQVTSMGYNLSSGLTNFFIASINNIIHSAGNREFGFKDYFSSAASAFKTAVGNKTVEGKKINALMKHFDTLKESSDEFGKIKASKLSKVLGIYTFNRMGEYVAQAPVMMAMLKKEGLWDKFQVGEDGEVSFDGEKSFDWNSDEYYDFKNKLDGVLKRIHGNYDSDSIIKAKGTVLNRATLQFRTWILETVNDRFAGEKYDNMLKRNVKGRYRTLMNTRYLAVYPLIADMYKAFTNGIENEQDAENLRKNVVELGFLLAILATALALTAGDDDDEGEKRVRTFVLNQLLRLQTDIQFYSNPASFEALTSNTLPVMRLWKDAAMWTHAATKLAMGEDEIGSGETAGQSRFWNASRKIFLKPLDKIIKSSETVMDK